MADSPAAGPAEFKYTPKLIILATSVIMSSSMQSLDGTIANVALPHIQGGMSASVDQIAWVLTSYVVASAICTPLSGFLANRFGRKTVILLSLFGFTVASLLCGAAQSLSQIVAFRLLQGAAGAFLLPMSQSILLDVYPPERHGTAMATWNTGIMIAPILGPTIGGYLTDTYSWRWVFYINLPLGVFCMAGIALLLKENKSERPMRFDTLGFIFLGVAVGALQLMLDRGTMLDWFNSTEITLEACIAGIAGYLFVVHMCTAQNPFLSREALKDANYVIGLFMVFLTFVVMFATTAVTPLLLQGLLGYPAFTAGMLMLPRGFLGIASALIAGRLMRVVDARYLVIGGLLVMAVSTWQMSTFNLEAGEMDYIWNGILGGVGGGFVFVPLSVIMFATLDPKYRTEAASMFGLVRSVGGGFGISLVATMLARLTQVNHATISGHVTPYNPVLKSVSDFATQTPMGAVMLDAEVNRQASMIAYLDVFLLMTYIMVFMACVVSFARSTRKARPADTASLAVEA
jgi:DHA2 family multidrug resistance protein